MKKAILFLALGACGSLDVSADDDATGQGGSTGVGAGGASTAEAAGGTQAASGTGGAVAAGAGGNAGMGGGAGSAQQGTLSITMAPSLVMGQADQLGIALTVSRGSGLASPILLSLEGMIPAAAPGYDEVSASFGLDRLEGSAGGTTLHFNTTASSDGGTRDLVVRATTEGAPDATAPLALIIGAQTVYEGAMPTNEYLTYGVRPNGDRCEWYVQWTGKMVVTFDSLQPGSSGTNRFIGTRTWSPLVDYVGETNCVGGSLSYDQGTPFVSTFPNINGSVDIVTSSSINRLNLGGFFEDPTYANAATATLSFDYERTASDESGGVDMAPEYEILLFRQSNRDPAL